MGIHTTRSNHYIAGVALLGLLLGICGLFIVLAHDDEERARLVREVERAEDREEEAVEARDEVVDEGYTSHVLKGAAVGGGLGGGTALVRNGVAVALTGSGIGAPAAVGMVAAGAVTGGVMGAVDHYGDVQNAQEEVKEKAAERKTAQQNLDYYDYQNSDYGHNCPYCGSSWSFSSYDEYMNFSHDHQ